MLLIPLLRKELHWSKRNVLVLGFLLILIPATFGATSVAFQDTIPENVPVAVVAQDENVTDRDMQGLEAVLNLYTDPQRVDSTDEAIDMMERDEVYLVIEVPPNIMEGGPDTEETFRFIYDGNTAPLLDAAPFLEDLIEIELAQVDLVEGNFTVESQSVGIDHVDGERSLAEYLYPTLMMLMLMFFAFAYVPYNLARDAEVLDRLRVESTLESFAASKLVYLTALMVVPLLVFGAAALWFGYDVSPFSPVPMAIMLLTFSMLATVAIAVMVVTRFSRTGQFINLLLMFGVMGASAIDFPRGVVSAYRPPIAELMPTHYAMIAARSLMLRDVSVSTYLDMIAFVVVAQLVALVALKGAIIYYRRTV